MTGETTKGGRMARAIAQYVEKPGGAPHSKQSLRLWLKLLSCSTVVEKRIRALLEEGFGTTLPRFDLLAALDRHPDGLTMSELSKSLMVSNGNVTGVVTRLIEDRLLCRVANSADRRFSTVRLTPKGRDAFARMAAAHEEWIDKMFADLSTRQIDDMMLLLGKLRESIEMNVK